jgi:hypothetical protein
MSRLTLEATDTLEVTKPTELSDELLDSVAAGGILGRGAVALLSGGNSLNGLPLLFSQADGPPTEALSGLATAIEAKYS